MSNLQEDAIDQGWKPENQFLQFLRQDKQKEGLNVKGKQKPKDVNQLGDEQVKQLKQFERSKISISRFVAEVEEDKVKFDSLEQQEIQFIPCPFCAVPLMLNQLEHINSCSEGKQCYHCKQRYPNFLFASHLLVCDKRKLQFQKKQIGKEKEKLQIKGQKKHQKIQSFALLNIKPSNENKNDLLNIKAQQKHEIKKNDKQELKELKQISKPIMKIIYKHKSPFKNQMINRQFKNEPYIGPSKSRQFPNVAFKYPQNVHKKNQIPKKAFEYDNESRIRQKQLKGFQQYEIDQIRMQEYHNKQGESQQCSICTMEISEHQLIIRLACSHFFHADCLKPWLLTRSRCPVCKTMIYL